MKHQTRKDRLAADKGIHRGLMLEMGVYNIHREKAYRDRSKYTRKNKHKRPPQAE